MPKGKTEVEILKEVVRAQARMIRGYRMAANKIPEWVFKAIMDAKIYYNTSSLERLE